MAKDDDSRSQISQCFPSPAAINGFLSTCLFMKFTLSRSHPTPAAGFARGSYIATPSTSDTTEYNNRCYIFFGYFGNIFKHFNPCIYQRNLPGFTEAIWRELHMLIRQIFIEQFVPEMLVYARSSFKKAQVSIRPIVAVFLHWRKPLFEDTTI